MAEKKKKEEVTEEKVEETVVEESVENEFEQKYNDINEKAASKITAQHSS